MDKIGTGSDRAGLGCEDNRIGSQTGSGSVAGELDASWFGGFAE